VNPKKKRISNIERRSTSVDAILSAALSLFVEQRFNATTIDQIAKRAGLSKGAVYFYFGDKITVLQTLLEKIEKDIYEPVFEILRDNAIQPQDRLVRFIHELSRKGQDQREALLLPIVIAPEFWGAGSPVEEKVLALYAHFAEALEVLVSFGKATGAFIDYGPTREMAGILIAMSDGMLLGWARRGDEMNGAAYVSVARRFLLAAMKKT
jgi:AcrR family transcriptional regulator